MYKAQTQSFSQSKLVELVYHLYMEINSIMYGITTAIVIIENSKLRIKNIIGSRL